MGQRVRQLPVLLVRVALLGGLGIGCGTSHPLHATGPLGYWHVMAAGETVEQLAAQENVPVEDLREINGLTKSEAVAQGRTIFILRAGPAEGSAVSTPEGPAGDPRVVPTRPLPRETVSPSETGGALYKPKPRGDPPLRWPVRQPRLSSPFGFRDGNVHEGIDLSAATGVPILAARAGLVLYAGDGVKGYGNMVVVEHDGGLLTVYAHASVLLVKAGEQVTLGHEIARVGQSGRATAPHLHFEVRRAQVPQDPLRFLPPIR